MTAKRICLDFDGVLHLYSKGWQGATWLEDPTPGAQEFVRDLQAAGFEVVVQSTRASTWEGNVAMNAWLARHGFPSLIVTAEKPMAMLYVDDRGFRFEGSFSDVKRWMDEHPDLGTWNKR